VIGREGAGKVAAIGSDVKSVKIGDRVTFFEQGTYAEYTAVNESKLVSIPEKLSYKDAAASFLQGLTAHYLAVSTYPIKAKDTVLVHAGAGGTGGLLIQMAKLRGARVITTVSTEEKAKEAKSLGADEVILYSKQNFLEEVKKLTNQKGLNCVYDGVGKATWENSMKCLRSLGTLVLFGNASGPVPPIDPLVLMKNGSLFLTRPTLNNYIETPEDLKWRAGELFDWMGDNKVRVRIAKEFDLTEASAAHEFLELRKADGKVVLRVNEKL
jgi:NADPH2:quinone reductase